MSNKNFSTVIIGLGGTGSKVLTRLKRNLLVANNESIPEHINLLAFDTESEDGLSAIQQDFLGDNLSTEDVKLNSGEFITVGGHYSQEYLRYVEKKNRLSIYSWIDAREIRNLFPNIIRLNKGAGQSRVLGRLALYADLSASLTSSVLTRLQDILRKSRSTGTELQVCIISSIFGGTGSSWMIDFPVILRKLAQSNNCQITLRAFLVFPSAFQGLNTIDTQSESNAFAAWRELNRLMATTPDHPAIFEYSENDPLLQSVVLDQPIYDHCYLFGKSEPSFENETDVFTKISDLLFTLTDEKVLTVIEDDEINIRSSVRLGQSTYGVAGIASVKNPVYWLRKYLVMRFQHEKICEVFGIDSSLSAEKRWSNDKPRSYEQVLQEFNESLWSANLYDLLRSYIQILKTDHPKQVRSTFSNIKDHYVMAERALQHSRRLQELLDTKHSFLTNITKYSSNLAQYPDIVERETARFLNVIFGYQNPSENYRQGGEIQGILARINDSLYDQFMRGILTFAENTAEDNTNLPNGKRTLGYFWQTLDAMQRTFEKVSCNLCDCLGSDELRDEKESLKRSRTQAIQNLSDKSRQTLFKRRGVSRAIEQYESGLRYEISFWINYYVIEANIELLQKFQELTRDLQNRIGQVAGMFLNSPHNLLRKMEISSDLALHEYKNQAEYLFASNSEISGSVSYWCKKFNQHSRDIPIQWSLERSWESTQPENEGVFLGIKFGNEMAYFENLEVERLRSHLSTIEKSLDPFFDKDLKLDQVFWESVNLEHLARRLARDSRPQIEFSDHEIKKVGNNRYYLILGRELPYWSLEELPGYIRKTDFGLKMAKQIESKNASGIMLTQFAERLEENISILEQYRETYFQVAASRSSNMGNPNMHILPAEIKASQYEVKIAVRARRYRKLLANEVVQLLQNESLLELFIHLYSHGIIEINRNEGEEVWFQISHPDLRDEIYLTIPERTTKNPIYKILDAAATFVNQGWDTRPGYRETKIDYSALERLLENRSRGTETSAEIGHLYRFYNDFKVSVQDLRNSQHLAFDDFVAVVDVIIERRTREWQEAQPIAPKPILKIEDNYVVSKPLTEKSKRLFVGRQQYFETIENIWRNQLQKASIVLYGQRRMGKTSLLYQLDSRLGSNYITVLIDFQGLGPQVRKGSDFWRLLAKFIQRGLREHNLDINEGFDDSDVLGFEAFDDYLDRIKQKLSSDQWLVILIDEFEKIEEKIDAGIISTDIFDSLRHIIQHRDKIILLLAGHHTLQERMKQYWNPLMETAVNVKLSYLTKDEARQLIVSPWDDFKLKYEEEAIERISEVSGGQPLLIQLVCKGVIRKVNQKLNMTGGNISPTATLNDVESVLQRMVVADDYDADTITFFFDAVWNWLRNDEKEYLVNLAQKAASFEQGWITATDMAGFGNDGEMLERLVDRDVLEKGDDGYRFRIDLLKQWVLHRFGS